REGGPAGGRLPARPYGIHPQPARLRAAQAAARACRGSRVRRLYVTLVAALAAAVIAAGCGGGGDTTITEGSAASSTQPVVVESSGGSFNPAQIYKDVSPGVVTIISVFDSSGSTILGQSGSSAGQGSGFVVDKDGDIVTNAHVVTSGGRLNGGGTVHAAKQVFVEF